MIEIKIAETDADKQACFEIRYTVFVGEQNVPQEMERDEFDTTGATHFLALLNGEPTGTGRLRIYEEGGERFAKIQRVAVLQTARGTGLGAALMRAIHAEAVNAERADTAILTAQISAADFYDKLGYTRRGDIFDDAGIPHIEMRLGLQSLDE